MRPFLFTLFVTACLSLLLGARPTITTVAAEGKTVWATTDVSVRTEMPKQCKPGKTSTEALGWRWRPNTRVHIYFLKDNFSVAETEAFSRAINNWNGALREMDSRIVFIGGGELTSVSENDASVTVMRGVPKGKDRIGQLRFYSMSNGVMRATMTISPMVTDLSALTSLMAHELGHSLGLADCYECRRGTTTMSAFKDENKGNDVFEPSECDKYVVALGYATATDAQAQLAPAGRR